MPKEVKKESILNAPTKEPKVSRSSTIVYVLLLVTALGANLLFGAVSTGVLGLVSIMLVLVVIFWVADAVFNKRLGYSKNLLQLPLVGLILIGIIQLLPFGGETVSADLLATPATSALTMQPFATTLAIFKLILFLVFFSAALVYLDSPKRLRITVFVLIVFGATMSFVGILQQLSNPELILWVKQVTYAQPFASYVNRHHFAAFLEMTVALTLGLLFAGSTKPDKRLLLIIAAAMMGLGIVFTTSRGALISLVAILAMLTALSFWSGKKSDSRGQKQAYTSKVWILIGGNIALIAFLFISVSWIGGSDLVLRSAGLNAPSEFSNGRLDFWSNTLEIVKADPILGTGLDTFGYAYTRHDTWNGRLRLDHAHNDYLQMLSDGGILGFLCIVSFIVLLFKQSLKTIGSTIHPYRRGIAAGALAACFGILVHSFFDFPLRTNANMFCFLICAALATVPVEFPVVIRRRKSEQN